MDKENYFNITIDFTNNGGEKIDLLVPKDLTIQEILNIVSQSKGYHLETKMPVIKSHYTGHVISNLVPLSDLDFFKDGLLLDVETL